MWNRKHKRRRLSVAVPLLLLLFPVACSDVPEDDDTTTASPDTPSLLTPTPSPGATPPGEPTPTTPTPVASATPPGLQTPTPPPGTTGTPAPTQTPQVVPTPTPDPAALDSDLDGFSPNQGDCDDGNPNIHPGASEFCNLIDDDCDGSVDEDDAEDASSWFLDSDNDGFGNPQQSTLACAQPDGYVASDTDCDDGDSAINPETTWYADGDGDGEGDPEATVIQCAPPTGYVLVPGDCDDTNPLLNSGTAWYADVDEDGYGAGDPISVSCDPPTGGGVYLSGDCDDQDPSVHPGAEEFCDGVDQNCDGDPDEGDCRSLYFDGNDRVTVSSSAGLDASTALTMEAWFMFTEDPYAWGHRRAYILDRVYSYRLWYSPIGDGYSIPDQFFCDLWDWTGVYTDHDHWETDVWYHIACTWDGTTAIIYVNGVEEARATVVRTLNHVTTDVTLGYGAESDTGFKGLLGEVRLWNVSRSAEELRADICGPADPAEGLLARWTFAPTGPQTIADLSGHGQVGTLGSSTAEEDSDPSWSSEVQSCEDLEWCDGVDNDGDGLVDDDDAPLVDAGHWYEDTDGDGWGDSSTSIQSCTAVQGRVDRGGDCDDTAPDVYPEAYELEDGVDNDCDGEVDEPSTLYFDGNGDYVYIGDTDSVDITGPITMEAWVYSEEPSGDEPILAKEYSGGHQQYWFGVYQGRFGLLIGNGSGWGLYARGSGSIPANTWVHLASVWTGSAWYNYQDGVLVGSGAYSATPPSTDEPLTIGINSSYDFTAFKGYLSDVRLWNVARTGDEIREQACELTDTTGLVGRWLLDDGRGQVAVDRSGTGNDGRLGASEDADGRDPEWSDLAPSCRQ